MLRHIGINVHDMEQTKTYYDVLMPLLGYEANIVHEDQFSYRPVGNELGTSLFFYPALEEGLYSRHKAGLQHLAFMVDSRAEVRLAYDKARVLGSEVIHDPQVFPQYRPNYYATFWLDNEGFMLEAVCLREEDST